MRMHSHAHEDTKLSSAEKAPNDDAAKAGTEKTKILNQQARKGKLPCEISRNANCEVCTDTACCLCRARPRALDCTKEER